ncbi:H-2 class II histocompatibility antigen, A-F beta chain-like isoform X1 [Acanthochromis polyacanthus]|uniref:H-2 class II histocompatibility antigen, A-F beta chain-like isoform X1 n=1 Tax=Acanthochromis polyacanthus TaxID=80966 RepID=UPI0022347982|nr:H-2 class II histocompatibility antigen, A-F beta chain-like isoform X1 [Acanthochromis polyacanthus]
MASSSISFLLFFITVYTADGFLHYHMYRCLFNSTELKDIEYISSFHYNKLEYLRFSSTLGKFVGYTEFGVKTAERLNNDTLEVNRQRAQKEMYCQHNIGIWYSNVLTKSVRPYVVLHTTAPPSKCHPAVLVCSVYDFYPKQIKVSWFRDGQEVTSEVTSTNVMEDGDWYYQIHSRLEYTPRSRETISCVVEHASLEAPLKTYWGKHLSMSTCLSVRLSPVCLSPVCLSSDPSMPKSDKEKIAIGASALILGLIFGLAGFFYYRSRPQDLFSFESEKNKIAIRASGLTLDQVLSLARFIYYKKNAQGRILGPY